VQRLKPKQTSKQKKQLSKKERRMMEIDLSYARNLSVVCPRAENIGWWPIVTDLNWWALYLWLRRN